MSMVNNEGTAVRVKKDTWERLSELKSDMGINTSFDDVVSALLDECGDEVRPDD